MHVRALHNRGPILASFQPPEMQKFPPVLPVYLYMYHTIPFSLAMPNSPANDPDGPDTVCGNADSCQLLQFMWVFSGSLGDVNYTVKL